MEDSEERLSEPINRLWRSSELSSLAVDGPSGGAKGKGKELKTAHNGLGYNDFLGLVTAIADLYSQDDVLEMQVRTNRGQPFAKGSSFEVSTIHAAFTRRSFHVSDEVQRESRIVVVKQSASSIFGNRDGRARNLDPYPVGPNSEHDQSLRGFISELRILSHPRLRNDKNIIRALGIHWDYLETGFPEPVLILEEATMDLREYIEQMRSLPFETKREIALDIARGIVALHSCGIIHGDIKPENVLMTIDEGHDSRPVAKISDFSLSFPDTGETRRLVGATRMYRAPEWQKAAPTSHLKQTDVYSYGLVFADIILGLPYYEDGHVVPRSMRMDRSNHIQSLKDEDEIRRLLYKAIKEKDKSHPDLHLENIPLLGRILDCTLQLNPTERSLSTVLKLLDPGYRPEEVLPGGPNWAGTSSPLTIPYHALQGVSPIIMDHIIDCLRTVSKSPTDPRRGAACMELAICEACGMSNAPTHDSYSGNDSRQDMSRTLTYTLEACHHGHAWAKSIVHRLSSALGVEIPSDHLDSVKDWLVECGSMGSEVALASLRELDQDRYRSTLEEYQARFQGNPTVALPNRIDTDSMKLGDLTASVNNERQDTLFHWIASRGDVNLLRQLSERQAVRPTWPDVNRFRNRQGDTPIICAARAGHYQMCIFLIDTYSADAEIVNMAGENPLHFLSSFPEQFVRIAASCLVRAGASIEAEATGFTGNSYLSPRPMQASCPLLRAVLLDKPEALGALLETIDNIRLGLQDSGDLGEISRSKQRSLLCWALRLHNVSILRVLSRSQSTSAVLEEMEDINAWTSDGRRHSLVELCILGSPSPKPDSGFDMPEKFLRMLQHGQEYQAALHGSLSFIHDRRPSLLTSTPRHTLSYSVHSANALSFAIQEGRGDAVSYLTDLPEFQTAILHNSRGPTVQEGGLLEVRKHWRALTPARKRWKQAERNQLAKFRHGSYDRDSKGVIERDLPFTRPELERKRPYSDDSDDEDEGEGDEWYEPDRDLSPEETRMLDLAQLVLACIVYGKRDIFFQLLTGPACHTLLEFDSTPLLFMAIIAQSIHRDIHFAYLLFSLMEKLDIARPRGWAAIDLSEELQLGKYFPDWANPLFCSASLRWHQLSRLLMEDGASPQSKIYHKSTTYLEETSVPYRYTTTVMQELIATTENASNEVLELLKCATQSSPPPSQIICYHDMLDILRLYPVNESPPLWGDHHRAYEITTFDMDVAEMGRYHNEGAIYGYEYDHRGGLVEEERDDFQTGQYMDLDYGTPTRTGSFSDMSNLDKLRWGRMLHRKHHNKSSVLWGAIAEADRVQQAKIAEFSESAFLVMEAVWRRNLRAVSVLLHDIGLDPNGYNPSPSPALPPPDSNHRLEALHPLQNMKRVLKRLTGTDRNRQKPKELTPLDVVSWTNLVPASHSCPDTADSLKAVDQEIRALLLESNSASSAGVHRGTAFSRPLETHLLSSFLFTSFLLPTSFLLLLLAILFFITVKHLPQVFSAFGHTGSVFNHLKPGDPEWQHGFAMDYTSWEGFCMAVAIPFGLILLVGLAHLWLRLSYADRYSFLRIWSFAALFVAVFWDGIMVGGVSFWWLGGIYQRGLASRASPANGGDASTVVTKGEELPTSGLFIRGASEGGAEEFHYDRLNIIRALIQFLVAVWGLCATLLLTYYLVSSAVSGWWYSPRFRAMSVTFQAGCPTEFIWLAVESVVWRKCRWLVWGAVWPVMALGRGILSSARRGSGWIRARFEYGLGGTAQDMLSAAWKGSEWVYSRLTRSANSISSAAIRGSRWVYPRVVSALKRTTDYMSSATWRGSKWMYPKVVSGLKKTVNHMLLAARKGSRWLYPKVVSGAQKTAIYIFGILDRGLLPTRSQIRRARERQLYSDYVDDLEVWGEERLPLASVGFGYTSEAESDGPD
ncbi:hypothetical protein V8F06_007003 [Rhypophila decipiens]